MFDKLSRKLTNNHKGIPLFFTTFNLEKFKEDGEKGSCDVRLHPSLKGDDYIVEQLNNLIDHIRSNYDMEEMI